MHGPPTRTGEEWQGPIHFERRAGDAIAALDGSAELEAKGVPVKEVLLSALVVDDPDGNRLSTIQRLSGKIVEMGNKQRRQHGAVDPRRSRVILRGSREVEPHQRLDLVRRNQSTKSVFAVSDPG